MIIDTKQNFLIFSLITFTIFFNLFFGYGMQLLTIFNLPISELSLIIILFYFNPMLTLKKMSLNFNIDTYIIFVTFGISYTIINFFTNGLWALRDGSHYIDSLFLLVGFSFLTCENDIKHLLKLFKISLMVAVLFIIFFSFKSFFIEISPKLNSVAGYGRPISFFFNFTTTPFIMIWMGFLPIIFKKHLNNKIYKILPIILISYAVVFFQARHVYLCVILIIIYLYFLKRLKINQIFISFLLLFFLISFANLLGLTLKGRMGDVTSIFFFLEHIKSILPDGGSDNFLSAAGTVDIRLKWWNELMLDSFSSIKFFLFGKGFGMPLIDYIFKFDIPVREPHNALLTIYTRSGIIGTILFIVLHVVLIKNWFYSVKLAKVNNKDLEVNMLIFLGISVVYVLGYSISESVFQHTFFSIIYYFCWGLILKIGHNLKYENFTNS